jgi:aryl-alcohol dehydrogenase-like predicted oxidoreductase
VPAEEMIPADQEQQVGEVLVDASFSPVTRVRYRTEDTRVGQKTNYDRLILEIWTNGTISPEMALVEAGKIRSVGVSNFNARQMRRAHKALQKRALPLAANQVRYSLMDRSIEKNGILDTAEELGITITAYTPLASGLLTGKYHKNPDLLKEKAWYWRARLQSGVNKSRSVVIALEEISLKYKATPAQVALNWVINSHGEMVVTIPGATKVSQAEESAGAMKFKLTADEMARLNKLSLNLS